MSHKNKASLVKQVTDMLSEKSRFGQSKFEAKKDGTYKDGIYSYSTLKSYLKCCIAFVIYCKEKHRCKNVTDCRKYVDEYLVSRSELSAYTLKLDAAAIAKLYGCSTTDFVRTESRQRKNIKRSRCEAKRDKHFSEIKNFDLVNFCRCTGLRRHELAALRGTDFFEEDGKYFIHVKHGKGGKERYARVIGDPKKVIAVMQAAGNNKVFPSISSAVDVHGYRRDYATAYYRSVARPVTDLEPADKYICRKDKSGVIYDRKAMLTVSQSLGHNRIDVIAGHYLD